MKLTFKHTVYASYIGYVTLAIINNISPLLFVSFQRDLDISLEKIGILVIVNFGVQMLVDFIAAKYVDKIGYRKAIVAAHVFAVIGLLCMGILPNIMPAPYAGLIIAICVNSIGGGLTEVLISPIVESVPGDQKASAMSLLHSFYCWGCVAVILLSTLFFNIAGTINWYLLPVLWSIVPLLNIFFFAKVPINKLVEDGQTVPMRKLFSVKIFWLLLILMLSAGAAEQAVSQWSSLFAESGLGVSKTVGDLLGPCAFAVLMGVSRVLYGIYGGKIKLRKALLVSSVFCTASYFLMIFSRDRILSLVGCALCGLFVGIMWPGLLSLSAKYYPAGGTAMFAIMALAGDVGCAAGPGLVGAVSGAVETAGMTIANSLFAGQSSTEIGLKIGLTAAVVFPVILLIGLLMLRKNRRQQR